MMHTYTQDLRTFSYVMYIQIFEGFVDAIFRGLPSDPASVIHLFLTSLLDKVIKNLLIPKTNKIKLLAAYDVLNTVSELFHWEGQYDIEDSCEVNIDDACYLL